MPALTIPPISHLEFDNKRLRDYNTDIGAARKLTEQGRGSVLIGAKLARDIFGLLTH